MREIEAEQMLLILQEISANPQTTQRDLASRLGMSAGKINSLVTTMIRKGFVKVDHTKTPRCKRGYLYSLTPGGVEEELRIKYLFLKKKLSVHKKLEAEIRLLKQEVNADRALKF
jgi:EPS-associated MarR family transcriptional regulator